MVSLNVSSSLCMRGIIINASSILWVTKKYRQQLNCEKVTVTLKIMKKINKIEPYQSVCNWIQIVFIFFLAVGFWLGYFSLLSLMHLYIKALLSSILF